MSTSGISDSILLGYYQTQLAASPTAVAAAQAAASTSGSSSTSSSSADSTPPWDEAQPSAIAQHAAVLSTTNFLNTSNVPLSAGATSNSKTAQDNQKLFSLYNAVNSLSTLAQMAQSSSETSGQLVGLNTRFQTGLSQIENYISSTSFNNFTLQAATPSSSVTSTATVPNPSFSYSTRQFIDNANINNPVSGLSTSDSFTIGITKGGTTTNVPIDLSQVQGPLTLGNIIIYINSQLSADGFSTRFQISETGQTATSSSAATYGIQITPGANESVSLSAPTTSPALYLAGSTGSAVATTTDVGTTATSTPADQQGNLTKLTNLSSGTPQAAFNVDQNATTGTTNAVATAVDSSGNVYVIGDATGNFGSQINQGSQDVYLTKYDSAGNVVWSQLLGSAGTANGYGLALDSATGGVVVTGTSTADLTSSSIGNGNNDSFVASYDSNGNQLWEQQIPTLAANQSNSVSVDASGNVYIGGQVSGGVIGAGQTNQGGTSDAYLAQFDSSGNLVAENQFGTSGADSVQATAVGSDGSLYVASVQNGQAIVSKYANGNITAAPTWQENLGNLSGGSIGGLTLSGNQVYVSGTSSNGNLTAGGTATVASASTGSTDAFVFNMTDNGSSATSNYVSYVGNSSTTEGEGLAVGSDGTVYLTGTTVGTFAGQQRQIQGANNAFVAALNSSGIVQWTQQYGGANGQSTGSGIAIDPNGSSILDALGLPSGTISPSQPIYLSQTTTLQAGDSFQIEIDGPVPRTATITVGQDATLSSLVTQINGELGSFGKASVAYNNGSEGLTIAASAGSTIVLKPGPSGFDALARLGIAAGTLSAPAKTKSSSSSSATTSSSASSNRNSSATTTKPAYGLGLTSTMDISTKTGADLARSTLLSVLSKIQSAYQTTNTPPTTTPVGNTTGTASAQTTAQLASYNTALSLISTSSSNAMNNIMTIVNGGTISSSNTSSSNASTGVGSTLGSSSDILSLFG